MNDVAITESVFFFQSHTHIFYFFLLSLFLSLALPRFRERSSWLTAVAWEFLCAGFCILLTVHIHKQARWCRPTYERSVFIPVSVVTHKYLYTIWTFLKGLFPFETYGQLSETGQQWLARSGSLMEVIFAVGGKSTIAFAERLVMFCVWFMLIMLLFASNKAKKM